MLFLLFTLPAFAQDGFKSENGKIVWEHVYPEAGAKIKSIIDSQDKMTILSSDDATFTGQAEAIKSTIDANSARLESDANFDVTITKVEGGYKVRVTNYVLLEKYGPMQLRIKPASLNKYYADKGKIRNSLKTQTDLSYVDGFLTGLFLPQIVETTPETGPGVAATALTAR